MAALILAQVLAEAFAICEDERTRGLGGGQFRRVLAWRHAGRGV